MSSMERDVGLASINSDVSPRSAHHDEPNAALVVEQKQRSMNDSYDSKQEYDEKKEDIHELNQEKLEQETSNSSQERYVNFRTPPRSTEKANRLFTLPQSSIPDKKSSDQTVTTATASSSATENAMMKEGYTALHEISSAIGETLSPIDNADDNDYADICARPLHWNFENESDNTLVYYRIVYRGVVSLLAAPSPAASRSGYYLSYGEVFASRYEVDIDSDSTVGPTLMQRKHHEAGVSSPDRSVHSIYASSVSSLDTLRTASTFPAMPKLRPDDEAKRIIRVDRLLTGGYAMDARDGEDTETPKRSNYVSLDGPSPILEYREAVEERNASESSFGYLFLSKNNMLIAERLASAPPAEQGKFIYRVVSSTPLPILTGPSMDAPKTKAMVLPGTIHEVSLRTAVECKGETVWFLRLSHRRGWIADRKVSMRKGASIQSLIVVKEVTDDASVSTVDDGSASVVSHASALSSVITAATPSVAARRRHRPPRRRRDTSNERTDKSLPRQIIGKPPTTTAFNKNRSILNESHMTAPSSNHSILSDDSSHDHNNSSRLTVPSSPDISYATAKSAGSTSGGTSETSIFYLNRVTAPRGLKILDAPQFQVNNLIHRKQAPLNVSSSHGISQFDSGPKHNSIFQTMSGRLSSKASTSKASTQAVFDAGSKARILPRGALFEASKRMETSGAYSQGAGLIKLSDNSGWAIVPRQEELDQQYRSFHGGVADVREGEATRAYEEVGNAIIDGAHLDSCARSGSQPNGHWLRIVARIGVNVSCPPPLIPHNEDELSPASSRGSSAVTSSLVLTNHGSFAGNDSDVASSVGSSFLDAVFRTPKKEVESLQEPPSRPRPESLRPSNTIPCGMCVAVEKWSDSSTDILSPEFVRLRGGQGWLPLTINGKPCASEIHRPEFRVGSFWFRVQESQGIKVRLGPSKRAPSIKSEDGVHFRFECGEFLRASEIVTMFSDDGQPVECYAKLYRNRHARLHSDHDDFRSLVSLTAQAEWVQVYHYNELYLEQCAVEPRIERHRQGWRYNVVPDSGVAVRKGPSFGAETTGIMLLGGESVLVNERVSPAGDKLTWLRLKDGGGWVHDINDAGDQIMLAHSLRHRTKTAGRSKAKSGVKEEIAYNAIIARLFHNDGDGHRPLRDTKEMKPLNL